MLYQVHLALAEFELTTIVENWNNVIYTNCLTYGSIKYVGNLVCTMQFWKTFIRYTHSKKKLQKPEKPNI
jgi:hypothetical protein